jgi:hypothetical protein
MANNPKQILMTPGVVIRMLLFIVVIPFLPLLISFRWVWWEAWAYGILSVSSFVVSR